MSFLFDKFAYIYDFFMKHTKLAGEERLVDYIGDVNGLKAADIGGGTGTLAVILTALKADVVIVDPCCSMTSIARKKYHKINVLNSKAENIPVKDNTFNMVFMKDSLHHIVDQKKAITEAVRILKPNGKIVILEFNPYSLKGKLIYFFERMLGEKTRLVCAEELSGILADNGVQGNTFIMNKLEYLYVGCKNGEY